MKRLAVPVLAAATLVLGAREARANSVTFFETVFNTDYVASATGLRGTAGGPITISGVSGTVTQALLYWHGPTNSASTAVNGSITLNGTPVSGTNIGLAFDNFWGFQNSQAYRADVTSIVNGNGTYTLANMLNNGTGVENGATLFVFFGDGNSANNRDVVLFNGNDSNFASAFDPAGWDVTLSGINYSGGSANLITYVSDGQNFGANDDGTLRVNGTAVATGGIFQGLAPGQSVGNGTLADFSTFNITSLLSGGPNTLHMTMDAGFNDALSLVVAGIDLPAGAAPPVNPVVPEPATMLLVGTGLALARRARRCA